MNQGMTRRRKKLSLPGSAPKWFVRNLHMLLAVGEVPNLGVRNRVGSRHRPLHLSRRSRYERCRLSGRRLAEGQELKRLALTQTFALFALAALRARQPELQASHVD